MGGSSEEFLRKAESYSSPVRASARGPLHLRAVDATPRAARHTSQPGAAFDFGSVRIWPSGPAGLIDAPPPSAAGNAASSRASDVAEDEEAWWLEGGGKHAAAPAEKGHRKGGVRALSMNVRTSGPLLGGRTILDYLGNRALRGYYGPPSQCGTFDTGQRAGANVQLYGVIPLSCRPSQFWMEQTVQRIRHRINGVPAPDEGETFNDFARHSLDTRNSDFRQEWKGGGEAPPGYIISVADIPSTPYDKTEHDVDHDRVFETSIVWPGGRLSRSWFLTTRIRDGVVTENEVC